MPAALIIWTDERVNELRARWAAGDAASAIARDLGTTRGSVIGKADRLKLGRPKSTPKRIGRSVAKRVAKPVPKPVPKPKSVPIIGPPTPSTDPWARPPWHRPCRITDLTNHTCRWPLWDSDAEPRF